MVTLIDLIENLAELDVRRESLSAIGRTADKYVDLNREQLLHGTRADKTKMPNYSYLSVTKFGKPDGPIMLYDTGAFHQSLQLDVGPEYLEIIANDVHDLEERFGNEIYGLTDNSQEYYNQDIFFPELMQAIELLTGLQTNQ